MDSVSVNKFRDTLKDCVERVISEHRPIKVTRRNGEDFIVVSAEDWERDQETLHILQSNSLMKQISKSLETHVHEQGYSPTSEDMNELLGV